MAGVEFLLFSAICVNLPLFRTRDDIIHMVISRTRDVQWILGEFSAPFHSVPEMVAYYATHRLKISDTLQISLQYPLPEEYL